MKNIKKVNIIYIKFLLGLIIISSCIEPLEEQPYSFLSRVNFYQTAEDAQAAIVAVYDELNGFGITNFWHCMNHSSDYGTIHRNATHMALDSWTITADHPFPEATWGWYYQVINKANAVIDNVPNIDMNETVKNQIIAEAKFARGYSYFHLVRMFGGVPIRDKEITSLDEVNKEKSSVEEVYEFLIDDLIEAEANLPATRIDSEKGRFTSQAAKVTLADVYLTLERWPEAVEKAKEVIDAGHHRLIENFEDVFSEENEKNDEMILYFVQDGAIEGNRQAGWSNAAGSPYTPGGSQVWQVDEASDIWLKWDKNDSRRKFSVYDYWLDESGDTVSVYDLTRPYPAFGKYRSPNAVSNRNSPLDWIRIRYADALLIFAEAENMANEGPTSEAYEAINKIRRRAYQHPINELSGFDFPTGMSQQVFRDSVIWERNKEFVLEQRRTYDLMRTGQFPEKLLEVGKSPNLAAKLFPIPQTEIDANEALTSEDQNPGY